jgi:predicted esterase
VLVEQLTPVARLHRFAVTAPTGPTRAANGPAWFPSLAHDTGPGLATTLDAIERHMLALEVEHDFDPMETVVVGWSQGAATALALALRSGGSRQPRTVVGLSPWLVAEADIEWDISGAAARGTRLLLAHGVDDEVVPVTQARSARRVLERAGTDVTLIEVDTGHDLPALLPPALTWLEAGLP